jgi:hypothetical protein
MGNNGPNARPRRKGSKQTSQGEDRGAWPPIEDARKEKRLIERGTSRYIAWLMEGRSRSLVSQKDMDTRMCGVYRQCFAETDDLQVSNDFVEINPYRVFCEPRCSPLREPHSLCRPQSPTKNRMLASAAQDTLCNPFLPACSFMVGNGSRY